MYDIEYDFPFTKMISLVMKVMNTNKNNIQILKF